MRWKSVKSSSGSCEGAVHVQWLRYCNILFVSLSAFSTNSLRYEEKLVYFVFHSARQIVDLCYVTVRQIHLQCYVTETKVFINYGIDLSR